jgi:DNA polymerase-1
MIEDSTERAERLKTELTEEWGINPGSSKQLREYFGLDGRKGWPVTDGGAPSTNQEAMKGLLAEEESVAKWLEWKEVEKIRSTYGESLRKRLTPGGRIHARFNPFGTATGRFSSSGPNLQNIPKRGTFGKQMRGLFWSGSDDRVLIKADYASIELWVAAVLWEDPYMQRALQQGVNMHVATAASLFGVKPEEVTKEQKATGKIVNFALLFGGSPNRILEEYKKNGIPIDEEGAQEVHAKFFRTYKGFAKRKEARRARPTTPRSIWARTTTRRAPRSGGGGTLGRSVWPAAPKMNHEIRGMGADSLP